MDEGEVLTTSRTSSEASTATAPAAAPDPGVPYAAVAGDGVRDGGHETQSVVSRAVSDAVSEAPTEASAASLREPLEHTRIATLEREWHSSLEDNDGEADIPLIRFRSPLASWALAVRLADEDYADAGLRLLLQDVHAERPENLCVKLEVTVTPTYRTCSSEVAVRLKKLFNADGEMTVLDNMVKLREVGLVVRASTFYRNAPCAACQDWGRLRLAPDLADVSFTVGGAQDGYAAFKAHKLALCARSPVFRSMFSHAFKESRDMHVDVEGVTPDAFDKFLEFLYSGHVEDFEGLELDVMVVADRYQFEALKLLCQREMFDKVNTGNVLDTLVLADRVGAPLLKQNALSVAVAKMRSVMASAAWRDFHRDHNDLVDDMLREASAREVAVG